jgi:hypothetical protein
MREANLASQVGPISVPDRFEQMDDAVTNVGIGAGLPSSEVFGHWYFAPGQCF